MRRNAPCAEKNLLGTSDENGRKYLCTYVDKTDKFVYVERVTTDPRYCRLGLGRTAVLKGIRRCGLLGATIAYVGSDQPFYQSLGFKKVFNSEAGLGILTNNQIIHGTKKRDT